MHGETPIGRLTMVGNTTKAIALALYGGLILWTLPMPAAAAAAIDSVQEQLLNSADPGSPAWQQALRQVREDFPAVRQMSTRQLADLLASHSQGQIVLLDARSADEFDVSHLRGAVRANTARKALDALGAGVADRIVVTYCSVGYRSSKLADELRGRGVANLYNLEGSLFQWANEGRPLHRGDEPADQVHPYDDEWGQLLDRRFRPH